MRIKLKGNKIVILLAVFGLSFLLAGCQTTGKTANGISFQVSDSSEAQWIRNGEPIEYEGKHWYPVDGIESFLDSEMLLVGEHLGVQYFVDKVDVRPFGRLYTKFDKNKFRFFELRMSE